MNPLFRCLIIVLGTLGLMFSFLHAQENKIPIEFTLEKPSFVTLVIEDINGKRIRNLVQQTKFSAGKNIVYWDGYDEGEAVNFRNEFREYDVKRKLVSAGKYKIRGLIHEGIKMRYLNSVYSPRGPKSTPWNNRGGLAIRSSIDEHNENNINSGGWIGEHELPVIGVKFKPKGSGFPYGPDQDVMIICGEVGEANDLVAWVDMDGNKLHGTKAVNWTGKVGWAANECVPIKECSDKEGNVYKIEGSQICKYRNGKLVLTIGAPGGAQMGIYDENRMVNPNGIQVDNLKRIWVAERNDFPRRVSLWDTETGKFIRAFYGPVQYGGGVVLDHTDSSIAYYGGNCMTNFEKGGMGLIQFKLDYDNCSDKPTIIVWQPKVRETGVPIHVGKPNDPYYRNKGHKYYTSANSTYYQHLYHNVNIFMVGPDSVAMLVASIGQVCELGLISEGRYWNQLKRPEIAAKIPAGNLSEILYAWSDLNLNAIMEPAEINFQHFEGVNISRCTMNRDLTFYCIGGLVVPPPRFESNGVPVFDLSKTYKIATVTNTIASKKQYLQGADHPVLTPDGYFVAVSCPIVGYKDGKEVWRYNGSLRQQPPRFPGDVLAMLKVIGPCVVPPQGDAGPVFAINSNKGSIYLFTSDGLFLYELGGHLAVTPLWHHKKWEKGMIIEGVSFDDEQFFPSITQVNGNTIFLVAGKEHSSVLRLEGWEKVIRMEPFEFTVTDDMLKGKEAIKLPAATTSTSDIMKVPISTTAAVIDGNFNEWPATATWVKITDTDSAALMIAAGFLVAGYQTSNPNLLENMGGESGDFRTIFKTGGALDLFMATDSMAAVLPLRWRLRTTAAKGDIRLIVTKVNGAVKAVLYEPVVPGTPEEQKTHFISTIGQTTIDRISDISNKVTIAQNGGNYEFAISLSDLGMKTTPANGIKTIGDIGILRGNSGRTVERLYWRNQNTTNVSDIPTEASFQPNQWGRIDFVASNTVATDIVRKLAPSSYIKLTGKTGMLTACKSNEKISMVNLRGVSISLSSAESVYRLRRGIYLVRINGDNSNRILKVVDVR